MDRGKYPKGMLLDVGCRDRKQPNFVGIDWRQHNGVDIVHDLEKFPYPIDSESCHTIKCAHVVEHIKPWLVFDFINEMWRMLLPGGQLMISAPYPGSRGYYQDPTHCTHVTEGTWQMFDPDWPLYQHYKPKPWKIEHSCWKPDGNLEAILRKRAEGPELEGVEDRTIKIAEKAIERGAIQKVLELGAFLDFIAAKPLKVVVEIGTARGGVFYALCQMAHQGATIISIDLPGGAFGGGYSEDDEEKFRAYAKTGQKLHFLRGNSHSQTILLSLTEILGGRKIDLLLIDGDHTYKGVKSDWYMYSPLVKGGGIVAFHDICFHPRVPDCQVDKFWKEVKKGKQYTEFVDPSDTSWGGIGVIVIGGFLTTKKRQDKLAKKIHEDFERASQTNWGQLR